MYFLCSENKGADQLRGYREADLRLCFRICKNLVFSRRGSYIHVLLSHIVSYFYVITESLNMRNCVSHSWVINPSGLITRNHVFRTGERLSCPHATLWRHGICDARRSDVTQIFMVQFFYFGIEIVNVLDL